MSDFIKTDTEAQDIDPEFLVDESDEGNVAFLARSYREAYDEAEVATKKADRLKRTKKYLSEKLFDAMTASSLDKIQTEDGSFGLDLKEMCSVKKDRQEDMFEYLEEIGQGDCIKRTVHFQTINKLYRDEKFEEIPEGLISTWQEKAIRIRRS